MPVLNEIYFVDSKRGDGRPTIVWLHGAGGNLTHWPYTLRRMPGWRVLTPDLPGHGRSSRKGHDSIENYAVHLLDWLKGLDIGAVVLGGHSMGAAIALRMAALEPALVRGLILMGAGSRMEVNPQLLRQLAIPDHLGGTVEQIAKWSLHRQSDSRLRQNLSKQLLENQPGLLYQAFSACARFDMTRELAKINQPTLVLNGEADLMMPAHLGDELAKGLKRGTAQTIAGAGHMMMLEKPREVLSLVEEFMSNTVFS